MTSLIIAILVGGACLAVAAGAVWSIPSTREHVKRLFDDGKGR